jgi:ketosteroid isomerase-like protein
MAHDIGKIVESFYDGMERRDYAALDELLDSSVEWNSAENFIYAARNPYVGKDAVMGILRQIEQDWDGFTLVHAETMVVGEIAIIRGRYQGKFKATGFELDAEFVHVLRFRDGKLVMGQTYTDTAQFRDAVNQVLGRGAPVRGQSVKAQG